MTKCRHGRNICSDCVTVSDAGKRAYDIAKSYAVFIPHDQRINSWIAFRLSDGGSDGVLYESKRDAVRHQLDEFYCAYFSYRNAPTGFASQEDAQLWLDYNRAAYDAGFRLPDPDAKDGGLDLIAPLTDEHFADHVRALTK